MRKRLRKKKHLGEFMEYGVHFIIRFDSVSRDLDTFLDAFLLEAIEAHHCCTAAGGDIHGDLLTGFIELGKEADDFMGRLSAIKTWVSSQPDIIAHSFSPLSDAWRGPFYDFDDQMKPVRQKE